MGDKPDSMADISEDRASSKKVGILRALIPFFSPYKLLVFVALTALFITATVSLALPIAARRVIDGFALGDTTLLNKYFLAAIGMAAIFALGTGLRYYMVTRLGERVVADLRKSIFDRMIGMSPAYYEKLMTGEVLSRITTDTTLILSVIGSSASWLLRNSLMMSGGLVMMLWTSPKLTGLVLLIVPLILGPILILGRRLRRLSRDNQDWIAASSGKASEGLLSVQTVQAFTHEIRSAFEFSQIIEKSFDSAKARIKLRAFITMTIIFVVFSGVMGVLWVGAIDVRSGTTSAGELVQFVIYATIVASSTAALSELWAELQRAAGATERLVELLNAQDSVVDPECPKEPIVGTIKFKNVSFSFPSRPELSALNAINFTIEPGATIALVGPAGAGKSTIIQLLQRFFDPQLGVISFGGVNLTEMDRSEFRKFMSIVPQDPVIFASSAYDNILFGRPDAKHPEVVGAAKSAAAHDFISKLPDGYDSFVGERGVMLSGGQKQRIAIARAILRDAPILLLDEATSALDSESEALVQQAFEKISKDRTTLVVAHRLATVKKADRILVMDKGQIISEGTHSELVSQGGLYSRLAELQFSDGSIAKKKFMKTV